METFTITFSTNAVSPYDISAKEKAELVLLSLTERSLSMADMVDVSIVPVSVTSNASQGIAA